MALVKDSAVVLRRLDYSETSQVLAVFTRGHGQLRLIAKGIKRSTKDRAAIGIDLLELGDAVISLRPGKEDNLATLTEWRQQDGFPHLRQGLDRMYAAQYAAEATAQLTELHDPHPALFDGLAALLRRMGQAHALPALVEYLLLLLKEIGLQPEWASCANCGRGVVGDPVAYFSSRQGGVVCRDCESALVEKRRVRIKTLETCRSLSQSDAGGTLQPVPSTANARADQSPVTPASRRGAAFDGRRSRSRIGTASKPGVEGVHGDVPGAFDLLDYHLRETAGRPLHLSPLLRAALGLSELI